MSSIALSPATYQGPRIERVWSMPKADVTRIPIINQLLVEEMADENWIFHLFNHAVVGYANDYLRNLQSEELDGVLLDAPVTFAQAARYHRDAGFGWDGRSSWWSDLKNEAARITKEGGKVISISWDSTGLGASRGFFLERLLIVNHGGHWHDSIVTVERKVIG